MRERKAIIRTSNFLVVMHDLSEKLVLINLSCLISKFIPSQRVLNLRLIKHPIGNRQSIL